MAEIAGGVAGGCVLPFSGGLHPDFGGWLPAPALALSTSFHIFMVEEDEAHLRVMHDVSDPTSSRYRHFLTLESQALVSSPAPEAFDEVGAWLAEEGATSIERRQDHFKISDAQPALLHRLFDAPFTTYCRAAACVTRTTGVLTVPCGIAKHVRTVIGLTDFPPLPHTPRQPQSTPSGGEDAGDAGSGEAPNSPALPALPIIADPATIRQQYGVPADEAGDSTSPAQAVFLPLPYTFGQVLLDAFNAKFGLPAITVNTSLMPEDARSSPDTFPEAAFDVQGITSMGRGVRTYFVGGELQTMSVFLAETLSKDIPFSVISMSMGMPNTFDGDPAGPHRKEADRQLVKLAARGVSFLAATGDWGAPGAYGTAPFEPSVGSDAFVGGLQDTACNSFTLVVPLPFEGSPEGPLTPLSHADQLTWRSTGGEGGIQAACPFPTSMATMSWCVPETSQRQGYTHTAHSCTVHIPSLTPPSENTDDPVMPVACAIGANLG